MNYNKGMDKQAEIYTASELARAAGVSVSYITRLCREGRLEAVKVGHIWIIAHEVGRRFLDKRK